MDKKLFKFASKAFKKLKKKLPKIKELGYIAQVSQDDKHEGTSYSFMITGLGETIAPPVFVNKDLSLMMNEIELFIDDKLNMSDVEVVYHQSQIKACEETISHHKRCIEKIIKNEDKIVKKNLEKKDAETDNQSSK